MSEKCPYHNVEMCFITSGVDAGGFSYEYWLCFDPGRIARPHIIRTHDLGRFIEFQEPTWNKIVMTKKERF